MTNLQIAQLTRLPQRPQEAWQGAIVRMPSWIIGERPRPFRPWVAVWVAVQDEVVATSSLRPPEERGLDLAVEGLMKFALDPQIGGYRPGQVQVRDHALAEFLREGLKEAGIDVVCRDDLPALDRMLDHMVGTFTGSPPVPGPLAGAGVSLDQMRRFAEAAMAFYRAAPWQHLSDEDLLKVQEPAPPRGLAYATVLGAAGQSFGLAFFGQPDDCWDFRRAPDVEQWAARRAGGFWCLHFGSLTDTPLADVDLWEEHGLPVAGDEAYPCLLCHQPDESIVRADATTLAFVEGLLRALAATTEAQIDSGRWSIPVRMPRGPAQFTLALPDLLKVPDHSELMRRGFTPDLRAMELMHAQIHRLLEEKGVQDADQANALIQREFVGKTLDPNRFPPRTALEKAQLLCYQAFDAIGRRRVQLARQALQVCPDCADAYVLLAEATVDPARAYELYTKGTEAGARALGPQRFAEDAGHFWGVTDTRPYMRARFGLAQVLERLGRLEEAAGHCRELLRLNPRDNQGVRYRYLPLLLTLGQDAEAARFMKNWDDEPTANWTYTRALLAYRLGGDCTASQMELRKALKVNPFVPALLCAEEPPDDVPEGYAIGSREEAIICAMELRSSFEATPGAIEWVEAKAKRFRQARREQKKRKRR